jgi:hypothetical protein
VYGAGEAGAAINAEALGARIRVVMEAQAKTGVQVSTEQAASLVAALYLEAIDGRPLQAATIERLLRAMR